MKTLSALFLLAAFCAAAPTIGAKTDMGEINGAKYRVDIPANWNGGLVVYCHGYAADPVVYKEGKLQPVLAVFADQGFAVAQSGYATGGWAIKEAVTDIESLRRYFTAKYGAPKETYVTGHSMGGFLTMMLVETFPETYDAGLALCGPLASPTWFIGRGAFDLRVVFDYYFPGALPALDNVPADFKGSKEDTDRVAALLEAAPAKGELLRRYSGAHNNKDLAGGVVFVTYILKEMKERAGGFPFDNRDIIYEVPGDENAVNDGVKRYTAQERAVDYLRNWYTPTGKLIRPLLAIHTTYDPIVPVRIPDMYASLTQQAHSAAMFVQQYVKRDGHCAILPDETARGFSQLREWKSNGVRPPSGLNR